ncbi:MAG: hypothetical protein ACM359_08055 [Bacillota bacterium]
MYHYRSPVGTFWIVWREESTEWWLGITWRDQSRLLGVYRSAQGAAAAVYRHMSGHDEWDRYEPKPQDPKSLASWAIGPVDPSSPEQ